ncbi:hypothetical protein DRQ33_02315, partial [bacterium]
MIPISIELENFRSYIGPEYIPLDFAPFFCIVGANGSGKSSIIEAMLWALFGKCREGANAVPIRTDAEQVKVKFDFSIENRRYKVIRTNGKSGHKLWLKQYDTEKKKFIELVKSHRLSDTQNKIKNILGADYTGLQMATVFVQNEASIFSTIIPSERRKVLAKLLGIERYENIRKKLHQKVSENRVKTESLQLQLNLITEQIEKIYDPQDEIEQIKSKLHSMENKRKQLQEEYRDIIQRKSELSALKKNVDMLDKTLQSKSAEKRDCENSLNKLFAEKKSKQDIISKEAQINIEYQEYKKLEERNNKLIKISSHRTELIEQISEIKQKISAVRSEHQNKISSLKGEISHIEREIELLSEKLGDKDEVAEKISELKVERQILNELSAKKKQFEEYKHSI